MCQGRRRVEAPDVVTSTRLKGPARSTSDAPLSAPCTVVAVAEAFDAPCTSSVRRSTGSSRTAADDVPFNVNAIDVARPLAVRREAPLKSTSTVSASTSLASSTLAPEASSRRVFVRVAGKRTCDAPLAEMPSKRSFDTRTSMGFVEGKSMTPSDSRMTSRSAETSARTSPMTLSSASMVSAGGPFVAVTTMADCTSSDEKPATSRDSVTRRPLPMSPPPQADRTSSKDNETRRIDMGSSRQRATGTPASTPAPLETVTADHAPRKNPKNLGRFHLLWHRSWKLTRLVGAGRVPAMTTTRVFLGALLLMGCPGVVGSGRPATETRTIGAFRTLRVENGFRVTVTKGERALSVTADDNVISLVETVVEGERLVLRLKQGTTLSSTAGVTAALTTDVLEGVEASGGARVTGPVSAVATFPLEASGGAEVNLTGLQSSLVTVEVSGGGTATLAGTTTEARLQAGGGATVVTRDLAATKVTVEVSGGSEARVSASNEVSGTASGGSTVVVSGNPATVSVSTSGGSTVTRN